ncbi:MAG TPA: hypothetical protein VHH36_08025, partial [Candidatus Thermoplasmatota archaeon]|nr:hypothetical protein [Candidatus Thermoplasmatota archaeon]
MRLLVLCLLLPLPMLTPAEAEGAHAVWFGPDGMNEGWHVRIPYAVRNPLNYTFLNQVAGLDLNLRDLLVAGGWPTSGAGSARALESFDLDIHSIRVVEYKELGTGSSVDGFPIGEVPSYATPGLLGRVASFNTRTSPDVHVEWVVPGEIGPRQTRYFMIQLDTRANGEKPPAEYLEADMAPLEQRWWIGRGTTLMGVASTLKIYVLPTERFTNVSIETYVNGRPRPFSDSTFTYPMMLFGDARVDVSSTSVPVRITSDRPILVQGFMTTVEGDAINPGRQFGFLPTGGPRLTGPVPSMDSGISGRQFAFVIPNYAMPILVTSPDGTTTARVNGAALTATRGAEAFVDVFSKDGLSPNVRVSSDDGLLRVLPIALVRGNTQMTTRLGAPVGSELFGFAVGVRPCPPATPPGDGGAGPPPRCPANSNRVCERNDIDYDRTVQANVHNLGDDLLAISGTSWTDLKTVLPASSGGALPRVEPGDETRVVIPENNDGVICPLLLKAKDPATGADANDARLLGYGGRAPDLSLRAPIGGDRARHFRVYQPVYVVAYEDGTEVVSQVEGAPRVERGLAAGELMEIEATSTGYADIVSSRPVAVLPKLNDGFFAGVDESLEIKALGPADYRGYLASLSPADVATEPYVRSTGPGVPAKFHLLARNLAKDAAGRLAEDTFRLEAGAAPPGWSIRVSKETLRLDGGGSAAIDVEITPPSDAPDGVAVQIPVTLVSEGNERMRDTVKLVVRVRPEYGVDLWFDTPGGPRSRTFSLELGATAPALLQVRNTGTVPDRILVTASPYSSEWSITFDETGASTQEVPLEAGETKALAVTVRAPESEVSQSFADVVAQSPHNAAGAAKVTAYLRVRAEMKIGLETDNETVEAQPGSEARFVVTFENQGADALSIRFNTTGVLPPGWSKPVVRQSGYEIDEISAIPAGAKVPMEVIERIPEGATWQERATLHFLVETIPTFPGDPVLRRSVDLVAVAGARHDLTVVSAPSRVGVSQDGSA